MSAADDGHRIASEAARHIVREGADAGIGWSEIAISLETTVAIVVATTAQLAGASDPVRFATEIIDTITEHAQRRVVALILGVPYEG